jgi:serralysin
MRIRMTLLAATLAVAALAPAASARQTPPPPPWLADAHVPRYGCARNFWVDPVRGVSWTASPDGGGAPDHPWRTLQDADDARSGGRPVLRAGDCVNLGPGRYDLPHSVRLNHGGDHNGAFGWVVYRSEVPHAARLVATGPIWPMIDIKTAYVILDGLDLDGANATARGEGVGVTGEATHHHVVVENCRIHGMGGGGVQLNDSEFFWVVGNEIWGNAATNRFQESGISIYQPRAAAGLKPSPADDIPFHIVVLGNISRDNAETFPCGAKPGCHTDGNGVIIDKTKNVDRRGGRPYAGRTLVAGNFVSGNGGGGIHLYLSEHVVASGNVAVGNHLDPDNAATWRGELSNVDSDDVQWIGNLALAEPGPGVLSHNTAVLVAASGGRPAGLNVDWEANTTCGGDPSAYAGAPGLDPGRNRFGADPALCRRLIPAMPRPRVVARLRSGPSPVPSTAARRPARPGRR